MSDEELALEFERQYAARSGYTVEQLRDAGRTVAPCRCGQPGCPGWQSLSRKLWREDPEYRRRNGGDNWPWGISPLDEAGDSQASNEQANLQVDAADRQEDNIHDKDDQGDERTKSDPGGRGLGDSHVIGSMPPCLHCGATDNVYLGVVPGSGEHLYRCLACEFFFGL